MRSWQFTQKDYNQYSISTGSIQHPLYIQEVREWQVHYEISKKDTHTTGNLSLQPQKMDWNESLSNLENQRKCENLVKCLFAKSYCKTRVSIKNPDVKSPDFSINFHNKLLWRLSPKKKILPFCYLILCFNSESLEDVQRTTETSWKVHPWIFLTEERETEIVWGLSNESWKKTWDETWTVMATEPLLFDQCKTVWDVMDSTAAC